MESFLKYLLSVILYGVLTGLNKGAFCGCTSLTSVTIPDSVTSIGWYAFNGCTSLKEVYISDIAKWCAISFNGYYSNPLYYAHNLYLNGELVTYIVIPDGVTSICSSAFSGCTGHTSVTIPNSVTSIGSSAFRGCTSLKSITIPNSVMSIGDSAFYGCTSLTSITIPDSVTSIGSYAFCDCTGLEGVYISDIAKWCGISFGGSSYSNPLYYAQNLYLNGELVTDLVIPDSVTSIGKSAFCGCASLTSVTIPDSVTSIGYYAFEDCYKLVEVINKSTLDIAVGSRDNGYVAYYAKEVHKGDKSKIVNYNNTGYLFYTTESDVNYLIDYRGNDKDLTLPESYNGENYEIYQYAFYNRKDITSVIIPNSVTSIASGAFSGCSSLEEITLPLNNKTLGYIFGTSNYTGGVATKQNNTTYYIPSSLKKVTVVGDNIPNYAFKNCIRLMSVTIPDSVTSIGKGAFSGCSSLEEMTLPLNDNTFGYIFGTSSYTGGVATTQNRTTYYIPSSLKKVTIVGDNIPGCAFGNCTSLTSITIPDSVTSIGTSAFSGCTALNYNEYDNAYYIGNESNKYLVLIKAKSKDITSCTINENCKFIHSSAFYNCTSLTSVTIPDSVTSIGDYAFYYCTSLKSITIPDSVTSIGKGAFSGCSSLEEMTLPLNYKLGYIFGTSSYTGGVETYQNGTYYYIPSSLKKVTVVGYNIQNYAFWSCANLTSITIPDGVTSIGDYAFYGCTGLTSITIPDNVTSIGDYAFSGCTGLTSITIPDSVTSIGDYAFYGCTGLTSVTIPDGVTSIGTSAFEDCTNLTSITIPDGVTRIGTSAFEDCTNLTSITIPDSVTSIGDDAFYKCTRLTSVYYKGTASEWSNIKIYSYNSALTGATRYYYSETAPTETGNYWHYGENGEIVVWGK